MTKRIDRKQPGPKLATILLATTCLFGGFCGGLTYVVDAATTRAKPFVPPPPRVLIAPLKPPAHGKRPVLPPPGSGVNIPLPAGSNITTNGQTLEWTAFQAGAVSIQLTGTWTGTLQFEATNDPVTPSWFALKVMNESTDAVVTSATANGTFIAPGGYLKYRLRASAAMTGTVLPFVFTNDGANVSRIIAGGGGGGGSVTADTELPAAAPMADSTPNPTLPWVGAFGMGWDTANWQRIKVDTSGRQMMVGAAASGAAVAGNPLLMGVSDGTNAQVARSALAQATTQAATVYPGAAMLMAATTNDFRVLGAAGLTSDGGGGNSILAGHTYLYNGTGNSTGYDRQRGATVFKPISLTAATAETTIWTPTAGKKFRLMGYILTTGAASTLTFKDGTGGTTIFISRGTTDQPQLFQPSQTNGILSAAANNLLTVTRGTSATLDGTVWGTEE